MTLRDTLANARPPMMPRLPDQPSVAAESASIATRYDGEGTGLATRDANALILRFANALESGDWRDLSPKDWKYAPWVWFMGGDPLAERPGFMDRLVKHFRTNPKRSACRALIYAYLRDFDPSKRSIQRIARELDGAVRQHEWAWTERHDKFALFAPDQAPGRIAAACLSGGRNPFDALESVGITRSMASGGMAAHAWLQAVAQAREGLSRESPNQDLLDKIMLWSSGPNGLTYPEPGYRAALAESLLLPWSARQAPDDIREKVTAFLLGHFKDPRLPINTKDWLRVNEDAVSVMRKWLTGVALEQFFVVVDQVAQEGMWRYRKAFWLAYYNIRAIDDAWVLFGPAAQAYARQAFGKTQSYGILEKSGNVMSDHSVLLMRIGKLTIADWSHSGKCHIWLDGNPKSPKLYRARYGRYDVVEGSDNGGRIHAGSENGRWQADVESYIQKATGIRLY